MRLRGVGFEVEEVVEGGMRRLLIEEDEEVDDDGEGEGAEQGEEEGEEEEGEEEQEEAEGQAGEEAAGEREEAGGNEAGLPQDLGCGRVDGRVGEASPAESRAAEPLLEPLRTEHACALDEPD